MHMVPWRPEESIEVPGSRVLGNCEPLDLGAGNKTLVLYKSSKYSNYSFGPNPEIFT